MNREDMTPEDYWRWAIRQTAASFALSGIPTRFDPVAEIDRLRALVEIAWDQGWVTGRCADPFAENPYRRNQ